MPDLGPWFRERLTIDKWALIAFAFVAAVALFGGSHP